MPYGISFGYGLQRLIDSQLQFTRTSHPTFLRLRQFPDVQYQQFAQLGFSIAPTGTNQIGTIDIPILPQPAVEEVSMYAIGQSMGKLRAGARAFMISATFVDNLVASGLFTADDLVWRDPRVVGIVIDGQLNTIVEYYSREVAGKSISWDVVTNYVENR
jgi:hypothetical protein